LTAATSRRNTPPVIGKCLTRFRTSTRGDALGLSSAIMKKSVQKQWSTGVLNKSS